MSTYTKITRHPNRGEWQKATWHDDYFGEHRYGVEFPGDKVVYPADQVREADVLTFWKEDVIATLRDSLGMDDDKILAFLVDLEITYKDRWNRDPEGGEGALEWMRSFGAGADL